MNHTKNIVALGACVVMLMLTANFSVFADSPMGKQMMDDEQGEMMPWAGRHGNRHMPYMYGQAMGDMMGYGRMMGYGNMMGDGRMMGYGSMMGDGRMMGYGGMMPMLMRGLDELNLSKQQRSEIHDMVRKLRKKHWQMMETNMELSDELDELYSQHPRNAKSIGAAYDKLFAQKKKMIMDMIEARNKVEALLTEEQRKKLESTSGMGYGMGYGMGFGMMH